MGKMIATSSNKNKKMDVCGGTKRPWTCMQQIFCGSTFVLSCAKAFVITDITSIIIGLCLKGYNAGYGCYAGLPLITAGMVVNWVLPCFISLSVAVLAISALKKPDSWLLIPFLVHQFLMLALYVTSLMSYLSYTRDIKKDLDDAFLAQMPRLEKMIQDADIDSLSIFTCTCLFLGVLLRVSLIVTTSECFCQLRKLNMRDAKNTPCARNKGSGKPAGQNVRTSRDKEDRSVTIDMGHTGGGSTADDGASGPKVSDSTLNKNENRKVDYSIFIVSQS